VLTAVALWLLSGLAEPLPELARHAALLLAAGIAVLRDAGVLRLPLPQRGWQVPQHVLHGGAVGGAVRFGVELGTGVRTYLSATTPYVLALALLLGTGGVGTAVALGGGFGMGRAATPSVRMLSGDQDAWDGRLRRNARPLVTVGAVATAVALLAMLLRTPT